MSIPSALLKSFEVILENSSLGFDMSGVILLDRTGNVVHTSTEFTANSWDKLGEYLKHDVSSFKRRCAERHSTTNAISFEVAPAETVDLDLGSDCDVGID